jgi:NAD-dependent DNA ligase
MNTTIKKYTSDPIAFIEKVSDEQLSKLILYASKKYYNESAVMTDDEFDFLVDELKKRDPKHPTLSKIGAPLPKVTEIKKVNLPYHMGSMDKYKLSDSKSFNTWLTKYTGPYTITDKLDGVSALYHWKDDKAHLYKRGDEQMGSDVSFLIPYIPSLAKLKCTSEIAIRGELIISLDNYDKYTGDKTNPRSMVAGLTNKKTIDPQTVKLIDFVGYEQLYPRYIHTEQLKNISDLDFITVHHSLLKNITFEKLIDILQDRKKTGKYEVDGIIITDNNLHPVNKTKNPEYAFAFKELPDKNTAKCTVIEIEWNISKDGYIKPTVLIEPVKLSGVTIKRATGFNAKFIFDNKIGKDSIIQISRAGDVIPHIEKVIKATQADMPTFAYKWNESKVDIVVDTVKNKNKDVIREQRISELTYFVTHANMKFLNEQTVAKLYDAGYDDIIKILEIKQKELLELDNFKETMADKIYDSIQKSIEEMNILIFANASNIFGHNFGEKRLKKIFEIYPKILVWIKNKSKEDIKNDIKKIEGFEEITASQFAEKIIEFEKLVNKLPKDIQKKVSEYKLTTQVIQDSKISGKVFVFSGFRNAEWEKYIENHGGKINSTVSSKTNYVVTTQEEITSASNSKVKKAIELSIELLNKENFEKKFIKN